jgi:hypothetical protein
MCLIQESRLNFKRIGELTDGFQMIRNDKGVGTAIILDKKIKVTPFELGALKQIQCCAITAKSGNDNVVIVSMYIPCGISKPNLESDLDSMTKSFANNLAIVGGDMNNSGRQNLYLNSWAEKNSQTLRLVRPKRPTFRTGSSLDHFLISTAIQAPNRCSVKEIGLEHKLIYINCQLQNQINLDRRRSFKYSAIDKDSFQQIAHECITTNTNHETNLSIEQIDQAVHSLTLDINRAIELAVPRRGINPHSKLVVESTIDHWFKERRRLRNILRRAKKHWLRDVDRVEHLKRSIGQASRKIREVIADGKEKVLRESIKRLNSGRSRFRELNALMGKRGAFRSVRLKDSSNKELVSEQAKADHLREFYADLYKGVTPRSNELPNIERMLIKLNSTTAITQFNSQNTATKPTQHSNKLTSVKEVADIIKGIKPKTSTGEDKVPNLILKRLPIAYTIELTKIINQSINQSYFPNAWKKATIIAIPKKQGILAAKEMRPISLTSNLGKIMEQVILNKIENELKEGFIPNHQFGFKRGNSAVDALTLLQERLEKERKNNRFLAVLSLDIKKAFDSVWREGLLLKCARGGLSKHLTRIIQSFMTGRQGRIKIGDTQSPYFDIGRGVPQGSRMGPTLYNLYVSDMPTPGKEDLLLQFADDTLVTANSGNASLAVRKVERHYLNLINYLSNWGIEVNVEKTQLMVSRPRKKRSGAKKKFGDCSIRTDSGTIINKRTLKYLGVTFEHKGGFKTQAKLMAGRGRGAIGRARPLLNNIDYSHKLKCLIYKLYIRPVATYACNVWAGESELRELEKMERWAFRYALNMVFRADVNKYYRNEDVYRCMDTEVMKDFVKRMRDNYSLRRQGHINPLMWV